MTAIEIAHENPWGDDIVALLETHLALMRRISPPGHVHALDVGRLAVPEVAFLTARETGTLLGVGALKQIGGGRGEIKSMHTAEAARGRGIGRLLVTEIMRLAEQAELTWIGLETGSQPEFEPARRLYATFGFEQCDPFDGYTVNPYSVCMSRPM